LRKNLHQQAAYGQQNFFVFLRFFKKRTFAVTITVFRCDDTAVAFVPQNNECSCSIVREGDKTPPFVPKDASTQGKTPAWR
jgi:hypothetical protein